MGFFKKKSDGYVDLSERLSKEEAKLASFRQNNISESTNDVVDMTSQAPEPEPQSSESNSGGFFNFFGGSSSASETQSAPAQTTSTVEERRKKLNDTLRNLTNRLEEQEKEIYQMKQRIEVLERKQRVGY